MDRWRGQNWNLVSKIGWTAATRFCYSYFLTNMTFVRLKLSPGPLGEDQECAFVLCSPLRSLALGQSKPKKYKTNSSCLFLIILLFFASVSRWKKKKTWAGADPSIKVLETLRTKGAESLFAATLPLMQKVKPSKIFLTPADSFCLSLVVLANSFSIKPCDCF